MLTLEHQLKLCKLFNEWGNIPPSVNFDPYRSDLTQEPYCLIFDHETGQVLDEVETWIEDFINDTTKVGVFSTMAKLMYAAEFGSNTKGHYPAIYAWRG